jgi:hypothetical protein
VKLIDILNKIMEAGLGAEGGLDSFLRGIATAVPDAAPKINELLAKLDAAAPPQAEGLVGELRDLLSTHTLNPRQHPSDLA